MPNIPVSAEPGMEPGTLGLEGRDLTTVPTPPLDPWNGSAGGWSSGCQGFADGSISALLCVAVYDDPVQATYKQVQKSPELRYYVLLHLAPYLSTLKC